MEFEQIIKRLEWLDKQQRNNQDALTGLDGRLESFETTINAVSKQMKNFTRQITDVSPMEKRLDQFDTLMTRQRAEFVKLLEEKEKEQTRVTRENLKYVQTELTEIQKVIANIKTTTNLTEIKKQIKERGDEMRKLAKMT